VAILSPFPGTTSTGSPFGAKGIIIIGGDSAAARAKFSRGGFLLGTGEAGGVVLLRLSVPVPATTTSLLIVVATSAVAEGGKRRAAICQNLCSSSFFLEAMASPPYTRARKKKTPTTDCSPTNCSHRLLTASDTIVQAILTPTSKTQETRTRTRRENTRVVDMQWTSSSLIILVITLIRVFVFSLAVGFSFFLLWLLPSSSEEGRETL
jgi:hypothetical protein